MDGEIVGWERWLDGKDGWMGREGKWLDEKKMKLIKREDRSTEIKEDWLSLKEGGGA